MTRHRFALVGPGIEQSLLPDVYNAAFRERDIPASYVLRPAGEEDLDAVLEELSGGVWVGANLEPPFDRLLAGKVRLREIAARVATVDTVWRSREALVGFLTAGSMVRAPLEERGAEAGRAALVIGSGPPAAAAAVTLAQMGMTVHAATDHVMRAHQLLDAVPARCRGTSLSVLDEIALTSMYASLHVVVLADRGVAGEGLPWSFASTELVALDMACPLERTPFLQEAAEAGCQVVQGWEMIVARAAASLELWAGEPAPRRVMSCAAREALEARQTAPQAEADAEDAQDAEA